MASNSFNSNRTASPSGTVVLTLEQLEQSTRYPSLRLTLRKKASQLRGSANLKLNSDTNPTRVQDLLGKLMIRAREETTNLLSEEKKKVGEQEINSNSDRIMSACRMPEKIKPAKNKIAENGGAAVRRLNGVFDGLNAELDQLRQMSLDSLEGMSPEQQEQVVLFWQNFSDLFAELMGLVGELFKAVCVKIREGYTIDQRVLKELFDEISLILKDPFSSGEYSDHRD